MIGARSCSLLYLIRCAVSRSAEHIGTQLVASNRTVKNLFDRATMLGWRHWRIAVKPIPYMRLRDFDDRPILRVPLPDFSSQLYLTANEFYCF